MTDQCNDDLQRGIESQTKLHVINLPQLIPGLTLHLVDLTLCLLGYFSCILSSADFFKIIFFENFFQEYRQSVKLFGSRDHTQNDE